MIFIISKKLLESRATMGRFTKENIIITYQFIKLSSETFKVVRLKTKT